MIREIYVEDWTVEYTVACQSVTHHTHPEDLAMGCPAWELDDLCIEEDSDVMLDGQPYREASLPKIVAEAIQQDLESKECIEEFYEWFEEDAEQADADARGEAMEAMEDRYYD